jgi:hypothetical protein
MLRTAPACSQDRRRRRRDRDNAHQERQLRVLTGRVAVESALAPLFESFEPRRLLST